MGTRQTRLLSPSPSALADLAGQTVQLILADGEVLRGTLEATGLVLTLRPSHRGAAQAVPAEAVREVVADARANR